MSVPAIPRNDPLYHFPALLIYHILFFCNGYRNRYSILHQAMALFSHYLRWLHKTSYVRSHGQTRAVDAEVDLGREATSRTAETLSRSPPFAPAA